MNIAIIGESKETEKFGNKCIKAYLKKGFNVFPVNPKETEIEGKKCFSSVLDIPEKLDIVSIYLPPEIGKKIIPEIIQKKPMLVYLNPGTSSPEIEKLLLDGRIRFFNTCSIRAIGLDPNKLD